MRKVFSILLMLCFGINQVVSQKDSIAFSGNENQLIINGFQLIGNKTTKQNIILREVTFKVGDTLNLAALKTEIAASRNNLLNTSLFNFVTIDQVLLDSTHVLIYVKVTERWYTWPVPIFSLAETNFNTWWKNRAFNRINYGMDVTRYNFRGRNEKLKLKIQMGFTEKVAIQYKVPYFDKNQTTGFSVGFGYSRNHEVNYVSDSNDRVFYKDSERYIRENYNGGVTFTVRRKFFESSSLRLEFNKVIVADTVVQLNPRYINSSDGTNQFLTLSYSYRLDRRNNKNYPLKGHYFGAGVVKTGLGLFDSNIDLLKIHLGFRKYWQLDNRLYAAGSINTWQGVNNNQPYVLQDGLGYSDKSTIRSYEFYVIDGQQMGIVKSQLKFEVIPTKTMVIPLLPVEKFKKFHYSMYLGIFADAGYVRDEGILPSNKLANELQYGSGISMDWISYYDIVFRTEYSINKFGEHGLFFHFVAPI